MERDSRANGARYFYREFPSVGADYSIEKELEILIEMFIPIRKKKEIITRFILLGPWRFSNLLLLFSVVEFRLWKR